ncbi:hypothetical protein ACJIZ3_010515 [Penstemon smallii]|uniref:Uncharacterized protein n=1 Tax=Penstemon smallii TaxID=265156 RepID=A0ABD3UJC0_9LAMI
MAYAVESLVGTLEHVLHLNIVDSKADHEILQSLLEKAISLLIGWWSDESRILELSAVMENRIRDAAYWAEDIIEIHISDLPSHYSLLDLKDVMEEFDSINKEMVMIFKEGRRRIQADIRRTRIDFSYPEAYADPSSKNNPVGLDGHFNRLKEQLITGQQSTLQIIPIVGMKGMGKTTLARELYNDLSNDENKYFDSVAWVTVSQQYIAKKTLPDVLRCLKEPITKEMSRGTDEQFEKHVKGKLKGRRYLFVVDNICDVQIWCQIKRIFPDDQNGSRIMLTTRVMDVANYAAAPPSNIYLLPYMRLDDSWQLLCRNVFRGEICPSELENIGKKIAEKCMGHPLVTAVIAGLLATSKRRDFWILVLEDISSIVTDNDERLLDVLSLCYNHLPHHLKSCFIYFGGFQAEYEIRGSKIIRLWIAEGLINPIAGRTLEESAEIYLGDLIDRNLVATRQQLPGSLEYVRINGPLWELCQKKAVEEKVFWFKDFEGQSIPQDTTVMFRITNCHNDAMVLRSFARSFLCTGNASLVLAHGLLGSRLLRVLDVYEIKFHQFPIEILQLVCLRYLALTCLSTLPSSISRFRNLQSLIIRRLPSFRAFALPSEVWEMTQLRHIKSKEAGIWYRPSINDENVIQENLQTLSNVQMFGFTEDLLRKFPNLKKLGLFCDVELNRHIRLEFLYKLETLKCSSDWSPVTRGFLNCLSFPASLRKLTLRFCRIPCGFLSVVGDLPCLEQLKLQKCDFLGNDWMSTEIDNLEQTEPEWEPVEGGFYRLRFLLMEDLNLVCWLAESYHFPVLHHLVVRDCSSLEEIPSDFGHISTLALIEVDESSPSVVASAMRILEKQMDYGEEIKVVVHRN